MKILRSRLLLSALLAAGTLLAPARAEKPPLLPAMPAPPAPAAPAPSISLDFPGGSLSDLVAQVGKASGDSSLNVIGEKAALATEVQPFSIRNANRDVIMMAIGSLVQAKGVRLDPIGNQTGVYVVSQQAGKDRMLRHQEKASFDSFQIGRFLDDQQTVENIVDVIRASWTMDPAHDPNLLRLKYHPPTKLLLVSGPPDAVDFARQVIRTLRDPAPRLRPPPYPSAAPK